MYCTRLNRQIYHDTKTGNGANFRPACRKWDCPVCAQRKRDELEKHFRFEIDRRAGATLWVAYFEMQDWSRISKQLNLAKASYVRIKTPDISLETHNPRWLLVCDKPWNTGRLKLQYIEIPKQDAIDLLCKHVQRINGGNQYKASFLYAAYHRKEKRFDVVRHIDHRTGRPALYDASEEAVRQACEEHNVIFDPAERHTDERPNAIIRAVTGGYEQLTAIVNRVVEIQAEQVRRTSVERQTLETQWMNVEATSAVSAYNAAQREESRYVKTTKAFCFSASEDNTQHSEIRVGSEKQGVGLLRCEPVRHFELPRAIASPSDSPFRRW